MQIRDEKNDAVIRRLSQFIERKLKNDRLFKHVSDGRVDYETFTSWKPPVKSDKLTKGSISNAVPMTLDYEEDEIVNATKLLGAERCTNAFLYPPMSAMYWHTNEDSVGYRTYYTFTLDKAVFRYRDPQTGELHEDWDDKGWTVRRFLITKDNPFWHSVWSAGRRFTFGFVS